MGKSKNKKKASKQVPGNPSLKTAADVIQRLRWTKGDDARFQFDEVIVGYKDFRFKGGCAEWELTTFKFIKEGGNIPEHAIEYIRDNNKILWKKSERYDIVFGSGRTQRLLDRNGEIFWNRKLPKKKKEYRKPYDPPDSDSEVEEDWSLEEVDVEVGDGADDSLQGDAEEVVEDLIPTVEFEVGMIVKSSEGRVGTLDRFISKTQRWRIRDSEGIIFKATSENLQIHSKGDESPGEKRPKRRKRTRSELIAFRAGYRFKKARKNEIEDTIRIFEEGRYYVGDKEYDITEQIQSAVSRSQFISAEAFQRADVSASENCATRFLHVNHSVLTCVAWFARNGTKNSFVLNFASAKNVGGGWRKGALAQEEAICRCSALDPCLSRFLDEYYSAHRAEKDFLYSHRMIYTPQVPVFRNDFLDVHKPLLCSVLTSAAPNKKHYLRNQANVKKCSRDVERAMYERCRRVLHVAARMGHKDLILGAWGCGVFGHDRFDVGAIWAELFSTEFVDVFDTVVFAHLIWNELDWKAFRDGLQSQLFIEELEFRTEDVEPWTRIEWGKQPPRFADENNRPQRHKRKKGKRGRNY